MQPQNEILARAFPMESNNWFFNYKGFTFSAVLDNKSTETVRGREMNVYTRMDILVWDKTNTDVTNAFFGPKEGEKDDVWGISNFTEFLARLNHFKELVDKNEKLQDAYKEFHFGLLGLQKRENAVAEIEDSGRIPAHTVCPFRSQCEMAQGGHCLHGGHDHQVAFSCAVARGFVITEKKISTVDYDDPLPQMPGEGDGSDPFSTENN